LRIRDKPQRYPILHIPYDRELTMSYRVFKGMQVRANFFAMPILLRLMTGHALVCVILFVVSVLPYDSYGIDGRQVSQAEWWSSGVGPLVSLIGLLGFAAGWSFLKKKRYARELYLAFLTAGLVVPYPFMGEAWFSVIGIFIVIAAGFYLFKNGAVASYFENIAGEPSAG